MKAIVSYANEEYLYLLKEGERVRMDKVAQANSR